MTTTITGYKDGDKEVRGYESLVKGVLEIPGGERILENRIKDL